MDQVGEYFQNELEKLEDVHQRELINLDESIDQEEAEENRLRVQQKEQL
jgi:hypothetical protein